MDQNSFRTWAEGLTDAELVQCRSIMMGILSERTDHRLIGVGVSSTPATRGRPPANVPPSGSAEATQQLSRSKAAVLPKGETEAKKPIASGNGPPPKGSGYITVGNKTFRKKRPQSRTLAERQASNWLESAIKRIKAARAQLDKDISDVKSAESYAEACYDHQMALEYRRLSSRLEKAGHEVPLVNVFRNIFQKCGILGLQAWCKNTEPPLSFDENTSLKDFDEGVKTLIIKDTPCLKREFENLSVSGQHTDSRKRDASEVDMATEEAAPSTSKQFCLAGSLGAEKTAAASSGVNTEVPSGTSSITKK
jgi:hypothetical protein